MGDKINILSEYVMKRIAAGEVVERPASVAKELIENALDAGASNISLWIRDSGSEGIEVTDDGEGMSEADAMICCERHSTSKIIAPEDLDTVLTLGFRGEALASIGSVSRMVITTRREEDDIGTRLHLENAMIVKTQKVATEKGTTVSVTNLFYNVPARRKFLKSPSTELRHIITAFRRLSLSHPEVAFILNLEDERAETLPTQTWDQRVEAVFSTRTAERMISVQKEAPGLSIHGLISAPSDHRKSRQNQFFFLNKRAVLNRSLTHAVLSAYEPKMDKYSYPQFAIFLELDPRHVDVNVHPTKIEVRFADEKYVHDVLYRTVKDVLKKPISVPDLHLAPKSTAGYRSARRRPLTRNEAQLTLDAQAPIGSGEEVTYHYGGKEGPPLWQVHQRYILSQIKSGLTIIDQHVAHERILYEKAMRTRDHQGGVSQQILFPQTVDLSLEDFSVMMEMLPHLEKIGFGIRAFGKTTVVIEAVPVEVKTGEERTLLLEMIDAFKEMRHESDDLWDAVANSFACKSAIKSGDRLTFEEMASLIDQLFATEDPYTCPHGRPVVVNLSLEEIDKRFGRS